MSEVSRILQSFEPGDPAAAERLLSFLYDELRQLAAARLAHERPGQTLQPTALVHEAWMRLMGPGTHGAFRGRQHFFGAAAEAMRRILVDQARRKLTDRRGGKARRMPELPEIPDPLQQPEQTVIVDELVDRLSATHVRQGEVAKMHVFLQMTFVEIAEVLEVSTDTVATDWAYARAWLTREWQRK